jgi:hypothetical protein
LDWQCCLAGSSKTAPMIFIFSIVLGAKYISYVKSIETHARAFLTLNILSIGTVKELFVFIEMKQKKIFKKKSKWQNKKKTRFPALAFLNNFS